MLLSPETMQSLLFVGLFGMALLAAFYLRRRSLSFLQYAGWMLLILLLPAAGPFLAIYCRPGHWRQ